MAFPGYGLHAWMNNTTWVQVHSRSDAGMATANMDDDSGHRDELIVTFPGAGVWVWTNHTTWVQLHPRRDAYQHGRHGRQRQDRRHARLPWRPPLDPDE
jgi:hypothetical protein